MEEVRRVASGAGGGTLLDRIKQAGMTPIQFGDALGAIPVAVGHYMRERDAYMESHPEATYEEACKWASVEAMRAVESTQQSSQTENRPYYARRGGAGHRLLMMFASAATLQSSWEALLGREWRAEADPYGDLNLAQAVARNFVNPEARRKFGKYLQAVVINHLTVPLLMEAVSRMFYALLGDEPPEPEDELKNLAVLILLGQFGRIAFVGSLVDYGLRRALGERPRGTAPSVFGTLERLVSRGFATAADLLDGDLDAALEDMDNAAQTFNAPYRHVRRAMENYGGNP